MTAMLVEQNIRSTHAVKPDDEVKMESLLYECLVELSYAQEAETLQQISSAKGKALVQMGMDALGVADLSAESLATAKRVSR